MSFNRSESYKDYLLNRLQDPEEAIAYLNAAMRESRRKKWDKRILIVALKDVADAHNRLQKMASKTKMKLPKKYNKYVLSSENLLHL